MTNSDTEPRGTLRYHLLASSTSITSDLTEPGSWGHEYIRHLTAELGSEFLARQDEDLDVEELRALGTECAKFSPVHNAEPDAVDLQEELEIVGRLVDLVDENNYARVCAYMIRYAPHVYTLLLRLIRLQISCVSFLPPPDDLSFLKTVHDLYVTHQKSPQALVIALRMADPELVYKDFNSAANP